jgi:uncharacterized membrane protein
LNGFLFRNAGWRSGQLRSIIIKLENEHQPRPGVAFSRVPLDSQQERDVPIIEETIDIEAGPADVFRFCHDAKSRPEWDEQVLRVELLSPAPMRLGTLLRVDAKPASGSSVFTWDAEVVSYHFPMSSTIRVLDTAFSSPFGPGSEVNWEFRSVSGGTRVTWIWSYKPRGFFASVRDALGGRAATQRAIRNSLKNLKAMVEGGRRAGTR